MCQAVLSPNLTKKFQWEVSHIADNRFPCVMLLGGLRCKLKPPKKQTIFHFVESNLIQQCSNLKLVINLVNWYWKK